MRFELTLTGWKPIALPLGYGRLNLVPDIGLEPITYRLSSGCSSQDELIRHGASDGVPTHYISHTKGAFLPRNFTSKNWCSRWDSDPR